jgi:hypothetical protein
VQNTAACRAVDCSIVDYSPWTDSPRLTTIRPWLRHGIRFFDALAPACARRERSADGLKSIWLTRHV